MPKASLTVNSKKIKEYKIIKQKDSLLKSTDDAFENELNALARDGWRVAGSSLTDMNALKVILEREKNR